MENATQTFADDRDAPGRVGNESPLLSNWGPFELRERVGQGGFGEVYLAWDPKLQREVALKLLRHNRSSDTANYDSVLREARLTAKVRHPNVVSVHGVDVHDGRVGFWTDFVHGKTLSSILGTHGIFGPREAALIGMELCRALGAVHAAGLLHRDIKPGNVMREEGGRILLMDFGLTQDSAEGDFGGTLPYMAPELFRGEPASIASDIYALGAMLYELVTGRHPVELGQGALRPIDAYKHARRRTLLEDRPDIPLQFEQAVSAALEANPAKRFQNTGLFLRALSEAAGVPATITAPEQHPSRRRIWPRVGVAAVAVTAVLLAAYFLPGIRGRIGMGTRNGTGAHSDYIQGQDLLAHFYRTGVVDQAVSVLEKSVQMEPTYAPAWAALGRAYWRRYQNTRESKDLTLASDTSAKALQLEESLVPAHVTLGLIYTEGGRNDMATHELELARNLDATSAEAWAAQGDLYRRQHRNSEAEEAMQKAADMEPGDWRWENQLGLYYMYYSSPVRLSDAVERFRQAGNLSADNPRPPSNLGLALMAQENFPEARAAFEKALALAPLPNAYTNLGVALFLEGEYERAAEMDKKSLELNPTNYIAAGNLAGALEWTPNRKEEGRAAFLTAIGLAEKALRERPKDAGIMATLGNYYAAINDAAKSLPLLRQAVALDPRNPSVLFMVLEGNEHLHLRDEALRYLPKAIECGYPVGYLQRTPTLAALRSDPRYSMALTRIQLKH